MFLCKHFKIDLENVAAYIPVSIAQTRSPQNLHENNWNIRRYNLFMKFDKLKFKQKFSGEQKAESLVILDLRLKTIQNPKSKIQNRVTLKT